MADKKKNKGNGSIKSGMPETMHSDTQETQIRWSLQDKIGDLHFSILDLRAAGVPVDTLEDVRGISRKSLKEQLDKDREAYFKNMRIVPKSLRRQVNQEFADLENKVLPLADNLVRLLREIPIPFKMKDYIPNKAGDYCVEFNSDDIEAYILKCSTYHVPQQLRDYYDELQKFIGAWNRLGDKAKELGIVPPSGALLEKLMRGGYVVENLTNKVINVFGVLTEMSLTPEGMFDCIRNSQVMAFLPPPETEDEE